MLLFLKVYALVQVLLAAGAIVTQDVPAGAVVAGTPAKVIKQTSEVQDSKREIVSALRKLNNE